MNLQKYVTYSNTTNHSLLSGEAISVHDLPFDCVVGCCFEIDEQMFCWDVVFATFLEDLPQCKDMVSCRQAVYKIDLVTSQKSICKRRKAAEEDFGQDLVGGIQGRDCSVAFVIQFGHFLVNKAY